ncbi:ankyrin repeat domain-containing protein [Actinokineospora soli]|uniref:Ankyrin repeat domain-containing protein n=1 Tax=Actinokineospora soli TaxID=1048753 RepID=A0ABW2TIL8_9PSEU
MTEFADPVSDFLAHACLVYSGDGPDRRARAVGVLTARPGLAAESLCAAAALGDLPAARAHLAGDPAAARREDGPFAWEPLLYLAYSRVPQSDPLGVARLLLDAGADPNAGYLWMGLPSPFTALTGAFGEGEDAANQPRHPASEDLARLLLERGADPNDSQALYNRMFGPDDGHLRLLFAHGLGKGDGGPWHARLGDAHPTPAAMLHDQLLYAATTARPARIRLLLDHGVPPESPYPGHPIHRGRSALELALRAGDPVSAGLLLDTGATPVTLPPSAEYVAAALRGESPDPLPQAIADEPDAVTRAVELSRPAAVRTLIAHGFPVGTALHTAALAGDTAMVDLLIDLGADPTARDPHHGSTPAAWARHNHHAALAEHLDARAGTKKP